MSDVLEKMKTRRSIRKYKPDMIPQEVIDKIIEAGTYAASGRNAQNTIIIQVTDPKIRNQISELNCKIGGWEKGFDPFYGAPAILQKRIGLPMYTTEVLLWEILCLRHMNSA